MTTFMNRLSGPIGSTVTSFLSGSSGDAFTVVVTLAGDTISYANLPWGVIGAVSQNPGTYVRWDDKSPENTAQRGVLVFPVWLDEILDTQVTLGQIRNISGGLIGSIKIDAAPRAGRIVVAVGSSDVATTRSTTTLLAAHLYWIGFALDLTGKAEWILYDTDRTSVIEQKTVTGLVVPAASSPGEFRFSGNYLSNIQAGHYPTGWPEPVAPEVVPLQILDTFTRSVGNHWGTANRGGAWELQGALSKFSVSQSSGRMVFNNNDILAASLPGPKFSDTDLYATIALDAMPDTQADIFFYARLVGTKSYGARVRVKASGEVHLHTLLNDTPINGNIFSGFTYVPNTKLRIRARVTGFNPTTLQAKLWVEGDPEPQGWLVVSTNNADGVQEEGSFRIRGWVTGGLSERTTTISYDNLEVFGVVEDDPVDPEDPVDPVDPVDPEDPTHEDLIPVEGNQHYTVSLYWRKLMGVVLGGNRIVANFYTDEAGKSSVGGVMLGEAYADPGLNSWQRVVATFTAPASARFASFGHSVTLPPTSIIDKTALAIEKSAIVSPYSDGTMPGGSWSGAENGSTSIVHDPDFTVSWRTLHGVTTSELSVTRVAHMPRLSTRPPVQSKRWGAVGSTSLRIVAKAPDPDNPNDTYIDVGEGSGLKLGMEPGKTYTAMVVLRLLAEQTDPLPDRARSLNIYSRRGDEPYDQVRTQAPNIPGIYPLRITFTIPENTDQAFIRLYNGDSKEDIWFDALLLVEGDYQGPYFDGTTETVVYNGQVVTPFWSGTPHDSTSEFEHLSKLPHPAFEGDSVVVDGTLKVYTKGVWIDGPVVLPINYT